MGNMLKELPNDEYQLRTPHHKNSWRGMEGHNFKLGDDQVNSLVAMYEKYARPVLVDGHQHESEADSNSSGDEEGVVPKPYIDGDVVHLFVTNKGEPFKMLTPWFYEFQDLYSPPFPSKLTPNKFRSVFANLVMENTKIKGQGPTLEEGAAMMGNSPATLSRVSMDIDSVIA